MPNLGHSLSQIHNPKKAVPQSRFWMYAAPVAPEESCVSYINTTKSAFAAARNGCICPAGEFDSRRTHMRWLTSAQLLGTKVQAGLSLGFAAVNTSS